MSAILTPPAVSVLDDALRNDLRAHLFAPLGRLRWRCRLYLALDGAVHLALALLVGGLAQFLLDRTFRFDVEQRALLNVPVALFWLWSFYRSVLVRIMTPLPDVLLARLVDRAHPRLHDHLTSAVQFAGGEVGGPATSAELVRAVLNDVCRRTEHIPFKDVLNHRRSRRRVIELLVLVVAAAVASSLPGSPVNTWFRRSWLLQPLPWPQKTHIHPLGFDDARRQRLPRGEELEIVASIEGEPPRVATLRWWTPSDRRGRERMTRIGNTRLELSLGRLAEDVRFTIAAGDERTEEYWIEAVERPRVVRSVARIVPPEYTGLDALQIEQSTVLEVLRGSTLEIGAWLNKPIASARFVGAAGEVGWCEVVPASDETGDDDRVSGRRAEPAPAVVRLRWDEPESGAYHFALLDADGLENTRPVRFTVKVSPDQPPQVQMGLPGVGDTVTPNAVLPFELRVEDTFGLAEVGVRVQKDDAPPHDVPLEGFVARRREYQTELALQVESFAAAPGNRLRIWAEASDLDPRGPNVGEASAVQLAVLSQEDFANELAQRELQLRREFERLIADQRALREALAAALDDRTDSDVPASVSGQRLAGLARRQDAHADGCAGILRRYQQILAEMRVNRAARPGDERRIGDRIITPLATLAHRSMPAAAGQITALRAAGEPAAHDAVRASQGEILQQMREVLANMLEWEGYREAVTLLRDIIAAQDELHQATQAEVERQLAEILGLEEPIKEPAPAGPPGAP